MLKYIYRIIPTGKTENSAKPGGYAILRKEVAVMRKYIVKILILTLIFLIIFTIKVK